MTTRTLCGLVLVLGFLGCGVNEAETETTELALEIPSGNLTRNPSFEVDTSSWSGWQSSLSRVTQSGAANGVATAKVTRTGGSAYSIDDTSPTVASTTSGPYVGSAYVKSA